MVTPTPPGDQPGTPPQRRAQPAPHPDAPTQPAVPIAPRHPGADSRDWRRGPSTNYPPPPLLPPPVGRGPHSTRTTRLRQAGIAAAIAATIAVAGVAIYAATGDRNTVAGTAVAIESSTSTPGRSASPPPTTSSRPAPPPPPVIPESGLEALLVDDAALSDLVGVPLVADLNPPASVLSPNTTDNQPCQGVLAPVTDAAYANSGWNGVRWQRSRNTETRQNVAQGVVSFPDATRALAYVTDQARTWRTCDGQTITFDPDTDPLPIRIHSVLPAADQISAVASSETRASNCYRVLRAVNNVVIDTSVCGPSTIPATEGSEDATQLAATIADRIPQ